MDRNLLSKEISKAYVGPSDRVQRILAAFWSGQHVLIEDQPGVGKTLLAQAVGKALGLATKRIQMTPDLIPQDLTGALVWNPKDASFQFRPGPLMAEVILIDELNRGSSKTQSAVLQAMEEKLITVDGQDYQLPQEFFVIATQNPRGSVGVSALPESQLDRFAIKISLGLPDPHAESLLLEKFNRSDRLVQIKSPWSLDQLRKAKREVEQVTLSGDIRDRIVKKANLLRNEFGCQLSTRAVQSLAQLSRAWAWMDHRDFVLPEDVYEFFPMAWGHRLNQDTHGKARDLDEAFKNF